jgi:thioredoxin reductase (NADPH)
LFIEAGFIPAFEEFTRDLDLEKDEQGYIKIKKDGATNMPGIFAAGDITDGSDGFRQVITAAAEGAIAARAVFNWLKK